MQVVDFESPLKTVVSVNLAVDALLTPRSARIGEEETEPEELEASSGKSALVAPGTAGEKHPEPEPKPEPDPEQNQELLLLLPAKRRGRKKKQRPQSLQIDAEAGTEVEPEPEPEPRSAELELLLTLSTQTNNDQRPQNLHGGVSEAEITVQSSPEPELQLPDTQRGNHPRSRPEPEADSEQAPENQQLIAATAAQVKAAQAFEAVGDWPRAVLAYETALATPHLSAARSDLVCGLQRAQSAATAQATAAIIETMPEHRDRTAEFANEMQPETYTVELEFEAPSGTGRHHHRVVLAESRLHVQSDDDWQEVGHEIMRKEGESTGGWWHTLPSDEDKTTFTAPPPPGYSRISIDYIPARTQLLRFTLVGGVTTYQNWRAGRTIGRSLPISLNQIVASRLQPMEEMAIRHIRADHHMALHRLLAVGKCSADALWDGHSLLWLAQDLGSLACGKLLEQHGGRCFDFGLSAKGGPGGGKSEAPAAVSLPPLAHISASWEYLPYRVEQMGRRSQGEGWLKFSKEQSDMIESAVASGSQTLIRMFHHGHHHILDPVSLTQERSGYNQADGSTRQPGDEPIFVVELIRRRPWPVLLVGGALRESVTDFGSGRKDIVVEQVEKPLIASQMAQHPDRAVSAEFAEVKQGVARFARQFTRHEQGFQGESTEAKGSWTEVWLPNPHSASDLPERHVVYTGGPAWEPWKPSLEDLQQRGGEWAIIADRVEELVDRCYGTRFSVLQELGLSLPHAMLRHRLDGTQYYGQLQPRLAARWSSVQEKQGVRDQENRPSGGAWELSMQVPGNDIMGAKGDKPQQPDYWRGSWPPTAGPIPVQPSGKTDRRQTLPPRIASGDGDQERLEGHGILTLASGQLYEGHCSESRRVVEYTDGVYCGEVAEEPRDSIALGGLWDGQGVVRHGQGRFVTTSSTMMNEATGDLGSGVQVLEGEWDRDRIIGYGTSDKKDFRRRQPKGRLEYPDGAVYYGEFVAGGGNGVLVRHGYGKHVSLDGSLYTGRWENDRLVERDDDDATRRTSLWESGAYGKGTTLIDDESIGRAIAGPKHPFWHAKLASGIRGEPEAKWNALLDSTDEDESEPEHHPVSAQMGAVELEHSDSREEESDDFLALLKMLGGATSARAHEVLSIAAGFHPTDASAAARAIAEKTPSGDEAAALLREIARGAEACGTPLATTSSIVGAE